MSVAGDTDDDIAQVNIMLLVWYSTADANHETEADRWKCSKICALSCELSAARAMLDDEHAETPISAQDDNAYIYGRVGSHNVVLACLPKGVPGTTSAANVAKEAKV